MKIDGIFSLTSTDAEDFQTKLVEDIRKLQNDNQEVEIQYQVNSFPNGQVVWSALLIGRK